MYKISIKRRGYIILNFRLKSIIKRHTIETFSILKIVIFCFICIAIILCIKYKPVYEVKIQDEVLGLVSKIDEFEKMIDEEILIKSGDNIDNVSLNANLQYEFKLLARYATTNEEDILKKLSENYTTITYKYYAVLLNGKCESYVDTLEKAEEVVGKIKSEYDGNGLELDLAISEEYVENLDELKIDNIHIAEDVIKNDVEVLIEEKEAREAIATINGINLSVLPVSGTITSRFSDVSRIRSYVPHKGLDIACSTGTDVKVVAKGKIVYAGWDSTGLGNVVKVDHGNGVQTWYAHCSKIYISTGDTVSAGDVISAVGSTGNSTGPHLHFEIRINGNPVNPQIYVYK